MMLRGSKAEKSEHLFNFISKNKSRFFFKDLVEFYKIVTQPENEKVFNSQNREDTVDPDWMKMSQVTWILMKKSNAVFNQQFGSHMFDSHTHLLRRDSALDKPELDNLMSMKNTMYEHNRSPLLLSFNDFDNDKIISQKITKQKDRDDISVTFEEFNEFVNSNPLYGELFNFFRDSSKNLFISVHLGQPYYDTLERLENLELTITHMEVILVHGDKNLNFHNNSKFANRFFSTFYKMMDNKNNSRIDKTESIQMVKKHLEELFDKSKNQTNTAKIIATSKKTDDELNQIAKLLNKTITKITKDNQENSKNKQNDHDISMDFSNGDEDIVLPNDTYKPNETNRNMVNLRINMFQSAKTRIKEMKEIVIKQLDKVVNQKVLSKNYLKINRKVMVETPESGGKKAVFVNNKNWNIVTSMIDGIQKSLLMVMNERDLLLTKIDFKIHNKLELESVFSNDFDRIKFKDYSPRVFLNIRRLFGISNENYIYSLGVDTFRNSFFDTLMLMLSEKSSGKSGSIMFHTSDGKYLVKSIHKAEWETLRETLSEYHKFIQQNPQTLITRFFGLHEIKCYQGKTLVYDIFVVIMNNVFDLANPREMKIQYDLGDDSHFIFFIAPKISDD